LLGRWFTTGAIGKQLLDYYDDRYRDDDDDIRY